MLSIGSNSYDKIHPWHKFGKYKPTRSNSTRYIPGIHSEIDCIRKLKRPTCSLTLVNVRVDKNGNVSLAKPCPNCLQFIEDQCNFKKIIYTINENEWGIIA